MNKKEELIKELLVLEGIIDNDCWLINPLTKGNEHKLNNKADLQMKKLTQDMWKIINY